MYISESPELLTQQSELNETLTSTKDSIYALTLEIDKTLREINAIEKLSRLEMEAPPDSEM